LQRVFNKAIEHTDCMITFGHRGEEAQNEAFADGASTKQWPDSEHNEFPSKAVDAPVYPIDWEDRERFTLFAGLVIGIGFVMGYNIRWGGDWNEDNQVKDNKFDDLVHFEIVD
jgi:peptidoglycan L-alanyl-D-glutamate endopeptidase CwlK